MRGYITTKVECGRALLKSWFQRNVLFVVIDAPGCALTGVIVARRTRGRKHWRLAYVRVHCRVGCAQTICSLPPNARDSCMLGPQRCSHAPSRGRSFISLHASVLSHATIIPASHPCPPPAIRMQIFAAIHPLVMAPRAPARDCCHTSAMLASARASALPFTNGCANSWSLEGGAGR